MSMKNYFEKFNEFDLSSLVSSQMKVFSSIDMYKSQDCELQRKVLAYHTFNNIVKFFNINTYESSLDFTAFYKSEIKKICIFIPNPKVKDVSIHKKCEFSFLGKTFQVERSMISVGWVPFSNETPVGPMIGSSPFMIVSLDVSVKESEKGSQELKDIVSKLSVGDFDKDIHLMDKMTSPVNFLSAYNVQVIKESLQLHYKNNKEAEAEIEDLVKKMVRSL
jgi:hypothetical protein